MHTQTHTPQRSQLSSNLKEACSNVITRTNQPVWFEQVISTHQDGQAQCSTVDPSRLLHSKRLKFGIITYALPISCPGVMSVPLHCLF